MPPNWNAGIMHEVELAERVGNARVALHVFDGARVQVEDGVLVARNFGGVGLAVKHPKGAAVAFGGFDFEVADHERKEIGRQRFRFRELDGRSRCAGASASRRSQLSAPLATACQFAGMSSVSDHRAFRFG